jgi:hypothetical protein
MAFIADNPGVWMLHRGSITHLVATALGPTPLLVPTAHYLLAG